MNKSVRNIIIRIIIMLILSAAVVLIGFAFRPKNAEPTEKEIVEGHDLILWYYDDDMKDFAVMTTNQEIIATSYEIYFEAYEEIDEVKQSTVDPVTICENEKDN